MTLLAVCTDPSWSAAEEVADLRCRVMSLYAQALWLAGRAEEARRWAEEALAVARRLGELEGVHEITTLLQQIVGAIAARPAPERPIAAPAPWTHGAEGDLQAASDALDAGDPQRATTLAHRAMQQADRMPRDVRVAVLARLVIARANPPEAAPMLNDAAEIARDADNATLLGTVARAAELLGVALGTIRGPDLVARRSHR